MNKQDLKILCAVGTVLYNLYCTIQFLYPSSLLAVFSFYFKGGIFFNPVVLKFIKKMQQEMLFSRISYDPLASVLSLLIQIRPPPLVRRCNGTGTRLFGSRLGLL
jgi:hypothetical protein